MKRKLALRRLVLAACLWTGLATAAAADTTAYTYDALGRLITVTHVGGPNDGVVVTYAYDAAGNRTQVTSVDPHPPTTVIVPLLGYLVIPLK